MMVSQWIEGPKDTVQSLSIHAQCDRFVRAMSMMIVIDNSVLPALILDRNIGSQRVHNPPLHVYRIMLRIQFQVEVFEKSPII